MTLINGHVLAGRFEVRGDEQAVRDARHGAYKAASFPVWRRFNQGDDSDFWLRGVDRETGASVLIEPRYLSYRWEENVVTATRARVIMAAAPPFVVEVLLACPRIVYSDPPAGVPRGTFSRAEAAGLALQACEAAARLHAAGIAGLHFDRFHLRVTEESGHARIHWLVPGDHALEVIATAGKPELWRRVFLRGPDAIESDIAGVVQFFFSLQPEESRLSSDNAEHASLLRMLESSEDRRFFDMAALARSFLPLVPESKELVDRVAALPSVTSVPPLRFDWDHVIADSEDELAESMLTGQDESIALPLAAAYHQRAGREWARGDRAAALRDAERAIALDGDFLPYTITRAVLLDTLGSTEAAYGLIDQMIRASAEKSPRSRPEVEALPSASGSFRVKPALAARDLARAYALRGSIALRRGDAAGAARDLHMAMDAHVSASHAHSLGAALYALGDFEGAAAAEARSVELSPANMRYRWALVGSLRKLGLDGEALAEAERIVAMEPDNASHREKLAVLQTMLIR